MHIVGVVIKLSGISGHVCLHKGVVPQVIFMTLSCFKNSEKISFELQLLAQSMHLSPLIQMSTSQ